MKLILASIRPIFAIFSVENRKYLDVRKVWGHQYQSKMRALFADISTKVPHLMSGKPHLSNCRCLLWRG